ncbi:MAG: 50S ribosomal protein L9 [Dehalococcoidia bacterium]|nr:MAG: 50S ribosomal protein L9 [Dehalococcoidia bacterium]
MKVIFLKNMPGTANAGDIKEVADGYARNYLIPKKIVAFLNPETTSLLKAQLQAKASQKLKKEAEFAEIAHQLEGKEISLQAKVGTKNRLYGSITSADIAAELQNTIGITIDKRKIELVEPIRELGNFDITIRLSKDIIPKIKVIVNERGADSSA